MTQRYTVEAVAAGPSNAIRAHEHPMLESGNLSFPEGRYWLDFVPGEDRSSYLITHRIEGAALISRMLESDQARYACIVSSPTSGYRETHVSESAEQEVRWNVSDLGEPPLFTPTIVCWTQQELRLSSFRDGVHRIWDKQVIALSKGSRLALGSVIQLQSSILHLLSIHHDDRLDDGQFNVEIESEPFRFRANVGATLYKCLRYQGGEMRRSIMTHIVTACLARLQRDYAEDDGESGWRSHRNLKAFAGFLATSGHGHWTDDEFRPERVATAIYPLVVPNGPPREADESEGE